MFSVRLRMEPFGTGVVDRRGVAARIGVAERLGVVALTGVAALSGVVARLSEGSWADGSEGGRLGAGGLEIKALLFTG